MVWQPELDEMKRRGEMADQMGGEVGVNLQHERGKLTIRERLDLIADANSFQEIGRLAGAATYEDDKLVNVRPSNSVIGSCRINGRKVFSKIAWRTKKVASTKHLLDPELLPLLDQAVDITLTDERVARERITPSFPKPPVGDAESVGVSRDEIIVAVSGGSDVRCLLYRPMGETEHQRPGYLHIHGGGYVFGTPEGSDAINLKICSELGVVVVSVDYRLAPEHPVPAPLDDCYAALAWLHDNARELNVDVSRVGIGGESAGGGLAAALAIKARDENEYPICCQQLTYPMLDDRTGSSEHPGDPLVGEFVWTRHSNQYAWNAYLGDAPRAAPDVPARAESLAGLPPTWMHTVTLDLFRDENIDYANRLMAAGVHTELSVFPGACHGYQGVPDTDLVRRFVRDFMEALARGLSVN